MSDILIRGMEMPTDGEHITIHIYSDGGVRMQNSNYGGWRAVPVPPHGRLGDLDEIRAKIAKDESCWCYGFDPYGNGVYDAFEIAFERIDKAPTIIPASK